MSGNFSKDPSLAVTNPCPEPQTKALLNVLQSGAGKKLEQMELEEARAGMKALMLAYHVPLPDDHLPAREELICVDSRPLPVRIYQPNSDSPHDSALVLFCHGGGWVLGDMDCYHNMLHYICHRAGVTIVSVEYGLAPEHKFPVAVRDCYQALLWTAQVKNRSGEKGNRIFVMGDSAGGNLAAALCLYAGDMGGPQPHGQVLLYPQLSLLRDAPFESRDTFGDGSFFISRESIAWAVGHYLNKPEEASLPLASPLQANDFSQFPRTLVMTAGLDPLHDEGKQFADNLKKSGVETDYHCFKRTIHAFLSFAGVLEIGTEGLDYVADWIGQHI